MKISERHHNDVTILDVAGKVTIGRGDVELRDAIAAALHRGSRNILLNLEKLRKIDSSGVGELVAARSSVALHGGELKLVNLSPKVSDVLHMTQIMTVLEVYDDEAAALATFERKLAAVG